MRTFNVAFPKKSIVKTILISYALIGVISFVAGLVTINHNHDLGLIFFKAFAADNIAFFIMVIAFKKYLSVCQIIELYNDRIIIRGNEPDTIPFKDIIDYKYGSNQGTTTVIIKLVDGKKFAVGNRLSAENLPFIEALNEEIEQLIASGKLQLQKRLYAPFLGSKWALALLICYSVFIYAFSQYFQDTANFKFIMVISCFIAFIGWVAFITVKISNASGSWYQRNES